MQPCCAAPTNCTPKVHAYTPTLQKDINGKKTEKKYNLIDLQRGSIPISTTKLTAAVIMNSMKFCREWYVFSLPQKSVEDLSLRTE